MMCITMVHPTEKKKLRLGGSFEFSVMSVAGIGSLGASPFTRKEGSGTLRIHDLFY